MNPQNPGYPAFAPQYPGMQPQAPVAPQPPMGVPTNQFPWQQPQAPAQVPQAPQPFAPQAPGFAPPMAPPQGFQPPQTQQYGSAWQGADQAQFGPSSANIPVGQHLFEWVKLEQTRTQQGKHMCFIRLKILQSSVAGLAGTECSFKQNMNPPKGGSNVAFNAIGKLFFPAIGFDLNDPSHLAQVESIKAQQLFSKWLLEAECQNTCNGKPLAGRQFLGEITPGIRTEKTPAGKEPFPFMAWKPYGPGLLT